MTTTKQFNNLTKYKRCVHNEEHPYTLVSNYLIKDSRLNFIEIGIMTYLLSNSDTYIFNSEYTQKFVSGLGKVVWYKAIKHLTDLGYLKKKRIDHSMMLEWEINEILFHISINSPTPENQSLENQSLDFRRTENQSLENQSLENGSIISTNETNINETSKNEPNKNVANTNISVLGEQGQKNSLGLNPEEEGKKLPDFDKVESITNENDFKGLLPEVKSNDLPTENNPKSSNESIFFEDEKTTKVIKYYHKMFNDQVEKKIKFNQFEKLLLVVIYSEHIRDQKPTDKESIIFSILNPTSLTSIFNQIEGLIKTIKENPNYVIGLNKITDQYKF